LTCDRGDHNVAFFDAYGWAPTITDEQILAALLGLNLERSTASDATAMSSKVESEAGELEEDE
jgi:hypothetical protein